MGECCFTLETPTPLFKILSSWLYDCRQQHKTPALTPDGQDKVNGADNVNLS